MPKVTFKNGVTGVTLRVFLQDATSMVGAGKTGLGIASAGLNISQIADNEASATIYTAAGSTVETITTLGTFATPTATKCRFKEVDATNIPGVYEIQVADARWAVSSARSAIVSIQVTGVVQARAEVQLTVVDPNDGVRGGMTALPNAAAEASGGLYTRGTGAGQIKQDANGRIDANVRAWLDTAASTPTVAGVPNVNAKTWNDLATVALPLVPATPGRTLVVDAAGLADANMVKAGPTGSGTAQTARDLGASVLLSAGTGTGQLDFTSGVVKANLAQILATALTETAGLLAGGFKQFFNVATPTGTVNSLPNAAPDASGGLPVTGNRLTAIPAVAAVTTVTNLTNAPTAGDFTATMKTSLSAATPAVTVSDKTGFSLSAGGVQAIWDALTSALTTTSSIGKRIVDFLTGDAYARIGSAGAGLTALGDTRIANLDATVSSRTKPADTQARVTLVDTATTLTNAPSDSSGVTTLLSRVPSGLFSGITSLAQWLGLLAGKQSGNSTARTEIRATGAGSGTFDETTDSNEALRDNLSTYAGGDTSGTTTLLSRLSAARAGYLDNLSAGAAALESSLQGLITTVGSAGAGLTAAATAVWAVATRVLTAGTNIVLAKGTGVTGFNDLSAAAVNAEADTALADAGVTTTVTGRIDAAVSTRATPAQVNTEADTAIADAALATAANLALVKAKTDKLTFDVDNALDANVQKVNDVTLTGNGTTLTPWGPV